MRDLEITSLELVDDIFCLAIVHGSAHIPQRFWELTVMPKAWGHDITSPYRNYPISNNTLKGNPFYSEKDILNELNSVTKGREFKVMDYATDSDHTGGGGYGSAPRITYKDGLFILLSSFELYYCEGSTLVMSFREDKTTGEYCVFPRSEEAFQGSKLPGFKVEDLKAKHLDTWVLIQKGTKKEDNATTN